MGSAPLTVHGNGKPGERFPLNTAFLSADHASRHGAGVFVYNGIDPDECRFSDGQDKTDWYLFLSKTSWSVKNVSGAMRLVSKAGALGLNCGRSTAFGVPYSGRA